MKKIWIKIDSFYVKGDEDDMETLSQDVIEKVMAMCEAETLKWDIDYDLMDNDEEDDF